MNWLKNALKWIGIVLLAIFGVLFGVRRYQERQIKRRVEEIEREAKQVTSLVEEAREVRRESERVLVEEQKKAEERKRRAKELSDRLNKLMIIVLIIALGLVFGRPILAAGATAETQPGDYDSLLKKYQEVVDIALEYKALYEEAERSNEILMAQIKALQAQIDTLTALVEKLEKWLDEMQQMITKLLGRKSVGVIGGLTVTGIDPPRPGAFLGLNLGF